MTATMPSHGTSRCRKPATFSGPYIRLVARKARKTVWHAVLAVCQGTMPVGVQPTPAGRSLPGEPSGRRGRTCIRQFSRGAVCRAVLCGRCQLRQSLHCAQHRSGSYRAPANTPDDYFDQTGTFKFEANIEYRFPIMGPLHGAVFFDSGNVWLLKEDPSRPGGKLKAKSFLKDLATGTGVGLRFDISMLVIRADLGIGIHAPTIQAKRILQHGIIRQITRLPPRHRLSVLKRPSKNMASD